MIKCLCTSLSLFGKPNYYVSLTLFRSGLNNFSQDTSSVVKVVWRRPAGLTRSSFPVLHSRMQKNQLRCVHAKVLKKEL